MHELTVRASHLVAPVRVRQSDPVIEADALVAREEARTALRDAQAPFTLAQASFTERR